MKNYITVMSAIFCVCSISTAQAPQQRRRLVKPRGNKMVNRVGQDQVSLVDLLQRLPARYQIAQLLMRGDKNGDRKLSPEEIPPQIKDRFGSIDTNKDGVIDQEELVAFAKTQDKTGGARRGGQGQNFEGAMMQINRGLKALEKSAVDVDSKAQDLANIQKWGSGHYQRQRR